MVSQTLMYVADTQEDLKHGVMTSLSNINALRQVRLRS